MRRTMRFRVTFQERTNEAGVPSEHPDDYVDIDVAEGVVLDKTFVERTGPAAVHNEERLEEDDSFLSVGSETWDYEIADDRRDEFIDAVWNSQMAMECEPLTDEPAAG